VVIGISGIKMLNSILCCSLGLRRDLPPKEGGGGMKKPSIGLFRTRQVTIVDYHPAFPKVVLPQHSYAWLIYLAILMAFLGISCSRSTEPDSPPALAGLDLEAEEYKVYCASITYMFPPATGKVYAICDSTATASWHAVSSREEYILGKFPLLSKAARDSYNHENLFGTRHALRNEFLLDSSYLLLPDEETYRLSYDEFSDRYPNSFGFIGLSKVGFDSMLGQALVYVEWYGDVSLGTGWLFQYGYVDGQWVMADVHSIWYSKK